MIAKTGVEKSLYKSIWDDVRPEPKPKPNRTLSSKLFLAMLSFDKLFAKLFCQLIVNRVAIICPFKCADMGRHGLSHTLTSVSRFDTVSQVLFWKVCKV